MVAQAEQDRMKDLLTSALPMLCKNGLKFSSEFCIEALIGITLDKNDVFLVSIKETVKSEKCGGEPENSMDVSVTRVSAVNEPLDTSLSPGKAKRKRRRIKNETAPDESADFEENESDGESVNKQFKMEHDVESDADSFAASTNMIIKREPEDPGVSEEKVEGETFTSDFPLKSQPVFPMDNSSLSLPSDTSWQEQSFAQSSTLEIMPNTSQEPPDGATSDQGFMVLPSDKKELSLWMNSCISPSDNGTWVCSLCANTFSSKSHARSHIKIVHLKERKYECPFCLRKFGKNNDRVRHEKRCKFRPADSEISKDGQLTDKEFHPQPLDDPVTVEDIAKSQEDKVTLTLNHNDYAAIDENHLLDS